MGLPDSAIGDVTYTSGTSVLRGNKSFSISMRFADADGNFNNGSFKVSDIGGYEIDLDAQEDTDDVTEFYINIPSFKFSFFSEMTDNTTSSGFDFGNILKSLSFINLCEITITYDGNSDVFLCQKSDFTYNRSKREVECKCYHPLKYSDQFGDIDLSTFSPDDYSEQAYYDDGIVNYEYNILTYRDLIKSYLSSSANSPTLRIQSDFILDQSDLQAILPDGGDDNVDATIFVTNTNSEVDVEGASSQYYIDSIETARKRVIEGALAEGAIVGNMFQEAFYVRRDYKGADADFKTSLNASDFEEFEIDFFTSTVKKITTNIVGNEQIATVNVTNPQNITITVPQFGSQGDLQQDDADNPYGTPAIKLKAIGTDAFPSGTGEVAASNLSSDALLTYQYVTGSVDTVRWSGTILGVDKLKPYQYAELNTNINEYLTDEVGSANNKIRFSSLKYDLKEDKIEFEAYSI